MAKKKESEYKDKLKARFFFSLAFKNIINHKRHMGIIIFGFTISITMLLSVYYWAGTSEELALNDFFETQDYQSYIASSESLTELQNIQMDLDADPLVELHHTAFSTQALFNTEGFDPYDYDCLPEESQNATNRVSITNAMLAEQATLERIEFLFDIEGEFSVENNGIMVSLQQIEELSEVYGRDIGIGDVLNLSIAKYRPNPSYNQKTISDFLPTYFTEYTIKGIFTIQEGVSIIQSALNLEMLSDSIIFPIADVIEEDITEMINRDIPYIIFVAFDKDEISRNGLDEVVNTMTLFQENIKADYPDTYIYILSSPVISLQNAYSRATITIVFMLPIIMIGLILTIFMVNIVVESRKGEIGLLRDRGADAIQILLLFIVEFIIVSLIGIILGIVIAYFVAALIPSFHSGGFSVQMFGSFLANMNISPGFTILVSLGFLLILVGYASFKIWWDVARKSKDTANQDESRKKFEQNIILGINIGLAVLFVVALVFSLLDTIGHLQDSRNFDINGTISAGYTFILFCLMLIFCSQLLSFLITDKIQPRMKGVYKRLLFNNAFFLQSNFKRKDKKLSTMTLALIIVSSVVIFSFISISSVGNNQVAETNYKNGADLRIVSYPIEHTFSNNITQFEGVNEVLPIFKAKGSVAYNDYTLYGVDAVKFSRVGNWDKSSFYGDESFEILQNLQENENGAIIGSEMSERLNLTIGDGLPMSGLTGGLYFHLFEIVGIIHSAPGLGLADGSNLEMLQPYDGFILLHENFIKEELEISTCQMFLGSVLPDHEIDEIAESIEETYYGLTVNPELINQEFMGSFVESYIPNVLTFFWIELITTAVIGIVLLIMFTDFTLSQRTHEYAIKISMGLARKQLTRLIILEIVIITFSAALGGIALGTLFTYSSFYLMIPLLTAHNIIPFTISIPIIGLGLTPVVMIVISILGILPSVIKYSKREIITTLRA